MLLKLMLNSTTEDVHQRPARRDCY